MSLVRWRRRAAAFKRTVAAHADPLELQRVERRNNLHALIPATTTWVEHAVVPAIPVSVIMATKNRAHHLPRAIASVLTQTHSELELVVVDDGSTDSTADVLSEITDHRLHVLHTEGVGLAAARNCGLEVATGDVVTYLDDDNVMLQGWPRAIAWAFDQFRDAEIIYGGRVIEDRAHHGSTTSVSDVEAYYPWIELEPFRRDELHKWNFMDANVLAHRRVHPEAHFDERTSTASDWDLALRFTRRQDAIAIPVLACAYTTREMTRMCLDDTALAADLRNVREINGIDGPSPASEGR